MRTILVLSLSITYFCCSAQVLYPFPLKGKVKSNKIFRLNADSLKKDFSIVEETEFDRKGQIITAVYYRDRIKKIEKHVRNDSTTLTYECECSDIDELEKNFQVINKAQLENQPKRYTTNPPTSFVTINTIDKKGNIVLARKYSAKGYLSTETRLIYNQFNKMLERNEYNPDLYYSEFNKYDSKGNLLRHTTWHSSTMYTNKKTGNKRVDSFDLQGNLIESRWYANGELYIHSKYSIKKQQDKVQFIYTNQLNKSTGIEKEITYKNGKEFKKKEFLQGKVSLTTETYYYATGFIKMIALYNEEHKLIQETLFANDKNNNWTEIKVYQKVIQTQLDNSTKTFFEKSEYRQETTYY